MLSRLKFILDSTTVDMPLHRCHDNFRPWNLQTYVQHNAGRLQWRWSDSGDKGSWSLMRFLKVLIGLTSILKDFHRKSLITKTCMLFRCWVLSHESDGCRESRITFHRKTCDCKGPENSVDRWVFVSSTVFRLFVRSRRNWRVERNEGQG